MKRSYHVIGDELPIPAILDPYAQSGNEKSAKRTVKDSS